MTYRLKKGLPQPTLRPPATALVACLLVACCIPASAHAQGYWYWGWWGPPPPPPPHLVTAGNQYYDFSPSGLDDLCRDQPALCASHVQQAMLASIDTHENIGWGLLLGGIGVGVGGAVVLVTAPCNAENDCISNGRAVVGASMLFGSLALELAAAFVWPSNRDLTRLVNSINADHPEAPAVKLQALMLDPTTPGLALGMRF